MIIIDLIRELMFQQNRTIEYLSQETGLPQTLIEDVVLREIMPTPHEAKIMLKVLGIDLEDVLMLY